MAVQDIPMAYVMAFNAVSAPAYLGVAVAQSIDCSLDGDEDFTVVVLAKDAETLQRFHDHIGIKVDTTKAQKVAMASTKTLRVFPVGKINSATPQSSVEDEL